MEVNTQSLRCTEKRSVLDAINFTGALAHANATQDVSLPQSHILWVFSSKSEQAQLQSMRRRYYVPASGIRVPFSHVLLGCDPLKIVGVIVRFITVTVMNEIRAFRFFKPADSDGSVKQSQLPHFQIAIASEPRQAWRQLSQNFPGPRYCVKVVEESVFNFVNNYALQGCLQLRVMVMESIMPELQE
jgi:hypothetical protein